MDSPSWIVPFEDPNVDVVHCSCGFLGTDYNYDTFRRAIVERLIQTYRKPLVCLCALRGAIGVFDYQSPREMRVNHHAPPPYREILTGGSWSGGDDGIENIVYGPSGMLTIESRYLAFSFPRPGNPLVDSTGQPKAPAGYQIGDNPSPTIAVVAGVVADLVGLARHHHVRYDAFRIENALFTGSRIIDGFPASEQVNGLVNALGAWRQLRAMSLVDDPANPVLTRFDALSVVNGHAINGFFETIGHPSGDLVRRIRFVRHGGYADGRAYRLQIRRDGMGETAVFRPLTSTVRFRRDMPVDVPFRIHPIPGDQIAFLQLVDDRSGTVMQQIPLHIIVPERLHETAPGVGTLSAVIPPRRSDSRFVTFPSDVLAVRAQLRVSSSGGSGIYGFDPLYRRNTVLGLGSTTETSGADPAHHVAPAKDSTFLLAPGANIWSLYWDNRARAEYENAKSSPAPAVPIQGSATFSEYSVKASVAQASGGPMLQLTNELAPAEGRVELFAGTSTARNITANAADGLARLGIPLPANAAALSVTVRSKDTIAPGAAAYLIVCDAKGACSSKAQAAFVHGTATISLSTAVGACCVQDLAQGLPLGGWSPADGSVSLAIVNPRTGARTTYSVVTEIVQPIASDSKEPYATRTHGENWSLALPAVTANQSLYWAFRLAPLKGETSTQGYLTALHQIR